MSIEEELCTSVVEMEKRLQHQEQLLKRAAELLSSVTGDENACHDVEPSWYKHRSQWYIDAGVEK